MEFKQITDLIKLVNKTDLTELKMKDGEFELTIRTDKYQKQKLVGIEPITSAIPMPASPANMVQQVPAAASTNFPDFAPTGAAEKENSNLLEIRSPMVGTFYLSPSPDKPAYIKVGDSVNVGDVVCIVEAMKLFNEIESEISGKVVKVLVEDASPVEYDQVLFLLEP